MNLSFEYILLVIFYVGAFQGVILSVLLFIPKRNRISSRLLGILTFFWALILVVFATQSFDLFSKYPHLLRTVSHVELTFLPLLYLSIKYSLLDYKRFKSRDLMHFIPLVFNILLYAGFYFRTADEKLFMVNSNEGYYWIASIISDEILTVQGIVYPILALLIIREYNSNIPHYTSNINATVVRGMKTGTILIFIAWVTGAIAAHLSFFGVNIGIDLFIFVYLFLVAIIYVISYTILRSPETFKLNEAQIEKDRTDKMAFQEGAADHGDQLVSGSTLNDVSDSIVTENKLISELLSYMSDEKPYLDPELSLQQLSDRMWVSRYHLSRAIKQYRNMNFYVFVNTFRVEEVKNLMNDPSSKNLKLISMAYDAGFNSKASFNRIFKQIAGITPSGYMMEAAQG